MLKIWIDGSTSLHYKCLSGKLSGGWGTVFEFEGVTDAWYGDCQTKGATETELIALVNALEILDCRNWDITIYSDSKTMVEFINTGELNHAYHVNFNMQLSEGKRTKGISYKHLWRIVAQEIRKNNFTFVWIERKNNQEADKMAALGRELCENKDIELRREKDYREARSQKTLKMIKQKVGFKK